MPFQLSIQPVIDAQTSALNTTINAARDNVKADNVTQIGTQTTNIQTAITAARSPIKSLQRGTVLSTVANSQDVTIAAVDMAKAVVIVNVGTEISNISSTADNYKASAELISSTAIRLRHQAAGGSAGYGRINWQVVEYY